MHPDPSVRPAGDQQPDRRGRARSEDGNVMILVPIGILVMLGLGALAVDSALLYRAQAELDAAAAGLANDAAAAVDPASVFDTDTGVALAPATLDTLAMRHAAVADDLDATCTANIDANGLEPTVTARCEGTAHLLFRPVTGGSDTVTITTIASAELRRPPP